MNAYLWVFFLILFFYLLEAEQAFGQKKTKNDEEKQGIGL